MTNRINLWCIKMLPTHNDDLMYFQGQGVWRRSQPITLQTYMDRQTLDDQVELLQEQEGFSRYDAQATVMEEQLQQHGYAIKVEL